MPLLVIALLVVGLPMGLYPQESGAGVGGTRRPLPRADEIALARSAAPSSVSGSARVFVFTDSGYVLAVPGSSDVACLVSRSWPESLEPECFDAEAAATIMPMEMRRTLLYHRGSSRQEADRQIADGLAAGTYRLPARPAVVYMMSASQRLISDDGRPVGAWKPHLMIYYPFLTNEAIGHHEDPDLQAGMVVDPGKPTANLLIVVPAFVPAVQTNR